MAELRATYRLQLGPGLGFAEVRALVPYLRALGVSHLYLSPSLQARAGSTHGYDVVDPTRVSDALGGEAGLRALAAEGLGVILDIVPNHMGTGDENRWWSTPELRDHVFDVDPETGWYRRFFDIDDLAAVRQELDDVFELTHAKVLELVRDGVLDGVRVDHPDGLADPAGYLRRLRERGVGRVWVEKILHPGETLRAWPVTGTVGYEFLNDVAALFVDPAGEAPLTALLVELTGERRPFHEVALEAQREQAAGTFSREVERLRRLAPRFGTGELVEGLARLPVYRTYVEPWSGRVEEVDRAAVAAAGMDDGLARALLLEDRDGVPGELVTRFQQTSPAVAAKGVEDTALYRYVRLLALNEVGGDPERFGLPVDAFHAANAERAARFPDGLLITQTHDTKRSGDVRARIGALAGMAEEWAERVRRWRELCAPLREGGAPDAVEEYLIYQTLVGVWPIEPERLEAYVEKALRERKVTTSWVEPDHDWEGRVKGFCRRLVAHEPFLEDFLPFAERVARAGERAALGQTLLKLTSPGVPDVYQGDELWALSLVDPDNRRPVDWTARARALEDLRAGAEPTRETIKLWLIWRGLDLRARRPGAFARAYTPVDAGPGTCAFLRGEPAEVLVVVPVREPATGELALPAAAQGRWRDALDGGDPVALGASASVAELTARRGLALLER
jgi:(1->4)-alpha-D-glucan 1-alpha-D-glucosylmutase